MELIYHERARPTFTVTVFAPDSLRPSVFQLSRCNRLFHFMFGLDHAGASPGIAVTVPLDGLLLVFTQLLFQSVDHLVQGSHEIIRLMVGYEIVLVLGGYLQIDSRLRRIRQIDNYLNCCKTLKRFQQLLNFCGDPFLRLLAQVPVPRGNLNLHE